MVLYFPISEIFSFLNPQVNVFFYFPIMPRILTNKSLPQIIRYANSLLIIMLSEILQNNKNLIFRFCYNRITVCISSSSIVFRIAKLQCFCLHFSLYFQSFHIISARYTHALVCLLIFLFLIIFFFISFVNLKLKFRFSTIFTLYIGNIAFFFIYL